MPTLDPADFLRSIGFQESKKEFFRMENTVENGVFVQRFVKAEDASEKKGDAITPDAVLMPPMRGFVDDPEQYFRGSRGVRENYGVIPYSILREIEKKNPVVSTIVNTRVRQARRFGKPSLDENLPGFQIRMKDADRSPSKTEAREIEIITDFMYHAGRTDYRGWEDREDNFTDILTKAVREYCTIDRVAIEIRRDSRGAIVDFYILDGATIKRVVQTGYSGSRDDFDPEFFIVSDNKMADRLAEAKLALVPEDISEIRYIQEINGRYVAAFRAKDIIVDSLQKRAEVRYYGVGYSPLEQAVAVVSAFLYGLAYNAEQFNSGTVPKIGLSFKDGNFSTAQMLEMQDQWIANHRGPAGRWRLPIFNKEVNVLDFLKSAQDMEYMKYMEFTGSLIASVMGFDLAEAGLRYGQAQNVLNENVDAKQKFSKDRGLHDILSGCESLFNRVMRLAGWSKRYVFQFTGISPEDADAKSRLETDAVRRDLTVNELRKQKDRKPIKGGDIILDPTFLQNLQNIEMNEQQEAGGGEDDDFPGEEEGGPLPGGAPEGGGAPAGDEGDEIGAAVDGAVDEAIDEAGDVFKAFDPARSRVRTLLK